MAHARRLIPQDRRAIVSQGSLRAHELDSDVAECHIAGVCDCMRKVSRRISDLGAVLAYNVVIGRRVRPSGRDGHVWQVVMVWQRGFVRWNFHEEHIYVGILKDQVMVALLAHRDGRRGRRSGGLSRKRDCREEGSRENVSSPPVVRKANHMRPYIL
jgi:hypothetical protein